MDKHFWIQDAVNPNNKGALRKTLKIKKGKKIPEKKLEEAAKKGDVTGKRARLAETLRSFKK
jgi:hypothetical protein